MTRLLPLTSADASILEIIRDKGLISEQMLVDLRRQIAGQTEVEDRDAAVIDLIVDNNYLTPEQITAALAEAFKIEVVDLNAVSVTPSVLSIVDIKIANHYSVLPIKANDHEVELAIGDPFNPALIDDLSHLLKRTVHVCLAPPQAIKAAIQRYYGKSIRKDPAPTPRSDTETETDPSQGHSPPTGLTRPRKDPTPIQQYIDKLITQAVEHRASDIHLEPLARQFRIRYRIDGVLHEIENPPKHLQPSILSCLKLMADLSIDEKRLPQDGSLRIHILGQYKDLRVSVLPTAYGESIVMRILEQESIQLGLHQLGFNGDDQHAFERLIALPDGMLLVTGPTGSGKTTTLYAALNAINHPDQKIITVEDPVEQDMNGINQVQVRPQLGMDFPTALRAILRQAPNVIMIGEIRDAETAQIAMNAALTGHRVFSTLHTNDATSSAARLIDLGIKPYRVSAALRGVVAQRLVRRLCPDCKAPYRPSQSELRAIGLSEAEASHASFAQTQGCPKCHGSGFRGRLGIFELLALNETLQQMIYENAPRTALRQKAKALGMRSMREDGLRKAAAGLTTLQEVLSATADEVL